MWGCSQAQGHSATGPWLQAQDPARGIKKNGFLKEEWGVHGQMNPLHPGKARVHLASSVPRVIGYLTPGRGRGTYTTARQAEPEARSSLSFLTRHLRDSVMLLSLLPVSFCALPSPPPPGRLMDAARLLLLSCSASGTLAYIFKVFTSKLALSHTVAPSSSIIHCGAGSSAP